MKAGHICIHGQSLGKLASLWISVLFVAIVSTATAMSMESDPFRGELFESTQPFLDIVASQDAYVSKSRDGNYHGKTENLVTLSYNRTTLLLFHLPGDAAVLAGSASIVHADISLWQTSTTCQLGSSQVHTLHALSDSWDPATLTYDNVPLASGDAIAQWDPNGAGFVVADITSFLKAGHFGSVLSFAIQTKELQPSAPSKWCKYKGVKGSNYQPGEWPRLRLWLDDATLVQAPTGHVPDFSSAGYLHGVAVPEVYQGSWKEFNVDDYLPAGMGTGADESAIRAALLAAEVHVQATASDVAILKFSPRKYVISASTGGSSMDSIHVTQSRVIWKGAGSGLTTISMENPLNPVDPNKLWSTPYKIIFGNGWFSNSPIVATITGQHPAGSRTLTVTDGSQLYPGKWVRIEASVSVGQGSNTWIGLLNNHAINQDWKDLNEGLKVKEFHQVQAIREVDGVTFVDLMEPMHAPIHADATTSWNMKATQQIEKVGVEGIRFLGKFTEPFVHHMNAYHDSGFSVLQFNGVVNSYIRDCVFENVNQAIYLKFTAASSVLYVRFRGNPGHIGMDLADASHNYVGFSEDECGMWHAFGPTAYSSGNVFHHVAWPATTGYNLHGRQAHSTLFDNVRGGWKKKRMGGHIDNCPNHLAGLVLWNFQVLATGNGLDGFPVIAEGDGTQGFCDSADLCVIDPFVHGMFGALPKYTQTPRGASVSSQGFAWPVEPASLYYHQVVSATHGTGGIDGGDWLLAALNYWKASKLTTTTTTTQAVFSRSTHYLYKPIAIPTDGSTKTWKLKASLQVGVQETMDHWIVLSESEPHVAGSTRKWPAIFIMRSGGSVKWNDYDGSWGTETGHDSTPILVGNTDLTFSLSVNANSLKVTVDDGLNNGFISSFSFRKSFQTKYLMLTNPDKWIITSLEEQAFLRSTHYLYYPIAIPAKGAKWKLKARLQVGAQETMDHWMVLSQSEPHNAGSTRKWPAIFIMRSGGSVKWNDYDGSWGTETGHESMNMAVANTDLTFTLSVTTDSFEVTVDDDSDDLNAGFISFFPFRKSFQTNYLMLTNPDKWIITSLEEQAVFERSTHYLHYPIAIPTVGSKAWNLKATLQVGAQETMDHWIVLSESEPHFAGSTRKWQAIFIMRTGSVRWNDYDGSWGTETGLEYTSAVPANQELTFSLLVNAHSASVTVNDGSNPGFTSHFSFRKSFQTKYLMLTNRDKWLITSLEEQATVSCGSHNATSCQHCPEGNGVAWCNGDCEWTLGSHQCANKATANGGRLLQYAPSPGYYGSSLGNYGPSPSPSLGYHGPTIGGTTQQEHFVLV